MNRLHTLTATFDLKLKHSDLSKFRGAVAQLAGYDQDLFHNHDNGSGPTDKSRQRYPLIQYRVHHGHAGIFGINEGAEALEQLIEDGHFARFSMNGCARPLELSGYIRDPAFEPCILASENSHTYRIYKYLPFSGKAYREYKSQFDVRDKLTVLQRLLRNHLVAFAWGVGWELSPEKRIEITINDLDRVSKVSAKNREVVAFDLVFSANAKLPEGVGIGRKSAFGFGATIPLEPSY